MKFLAVTCLVMATVGMKLPDMPCSGWKASAQKLVQPSGIFQYMNGAGELYLAYGFKELYVRDYSKPGQPRVTCELYRMPSSEDSYGLYSQDRTGTAVKIGQGAVYGSGLLFAWQGPWFIRVMADRETPEAKSCCLALARQVVKLCGPAGKPPVALGWLPSTGLDPKSVHFFHTNVCLNYFHFVSTENILDLSLQTDVVMGSYAGKSGKSLAMVAGYGSTTAARSAWAKFRKKFLAGLKSQGEYSVAQLEDGKWLAGGVTGRRLYLVLESASRDECLTLARRLADKQHQQGGK